MDKNKILKLLEATQNPSRVKVGLTPDYAVLFSAENTNDTWSWFHVNAAKVEKGLEELGYNWVYQFETIPGGLPFIYLYFAPGLTKEFVEKDMQHSMDNKPDDREIYFAEGNFANLNVDQYREVSALEDAINRHASDVFAVYEA